MLEKGKAARERGLGFAISKIYQRRPLNITAVDGLATHFTTRACGHGHETVRHVEPDRSVAYICRSCWRRTCAVEFKALVRDRFAALFGKCWPHRIFGGALAEGAYV